MKLTFETKTVLNQEQLFAIMRDYFEKKADKQLANFSWEETDAGMTCELVFCAETKEINNE